MRRSNLSLLLVVFSLMGSVAFALEPSPVDITCSQGEDCIKVLVLKAGGQPMNLSGYTYRAQIRTTPADIQPLAEIPIDVSALTTGTVLLALPGALTNQLGGKVAYWDLRQTDPSGRVSYPMRGKFKCYWAITR